jgi:predicted nicotinamide N-methyase
VRPAALTGPAFRPGGAGPARRPAEFIRAITRLTAPPMLPDLLLHLADEPLVVWEQTELAAGRSGLPVPFWAFPWAGGIALARYLLDHPELVAGRVVLDLASGSGLVAIAAATAGAAAVTAIEIDPLAVVAIALNAEANGVTIAARPGDLRSALAGLPGALAGGLADPPDGRADPPDGRADPPGALANLPGGFASPLPGGTDRPGRRADLVLAGDAFYERELAERALPVLASARAAGAQVLAGDPGRAYLPRTGLTPVASYDVPAWPGLEDSAVKRTTVWRPG